MFKRKPNDHRIDSTFNVFGCVMKISILRNEPFAMLIIATGYSETYLEDVIIKRMIDEGLMAGDQLDCGLSLLVIAKSNNYNLYELIQVIFKSPIKNPEVFELMDSIVLWGDGSDHPCPECGCECDHEVDGRIDTWTCENSECDFVDSNEPDVDVLPGGYAYKQENK